ncbi:MAG: undecaprenyl-diphosphate phosphatase, partial [Ruminococcaceae bacterium]|nr:undecaprenyl-diphosphate phosphatase [Oscillospiraceae bacterium]
LALIIYGAAFILLERRRGGRSPSVCDTEKISYRHALLIGVFQVLSLIPGTSRSGATILGASLLGLSRTAAAEFSFFMAIPTMLGASLLKTAKFVGTGIIMTPTEALLLAVGSATAFLVSLISIKFLTDFVKRHSFSPFGIYRIVLGGAVLVYFLIFGR